MVRIREATEKDRELWDTFVESEAGGFHHCFNWKYFFEAIGDQFIPLLVENDDSQLIGLIPIVKEKRLLYTRLNSDVRPGGLLLKGGLSEQEKARAITAILEYVDANYSKGCSRFVLSENFNSKTEINEEPTEAFSNSGYLFRYDPATRLPCTFILKLEKPFKEKIWGKLWSHNLRNKANRAERKGFEILVDQEFVYVEDFIKMFAANYKRHGTKPLTRDQVLIAINKFQDKVKLCVALQNGQPFLGMLFYYHSTECVLWELGSYVKDTQNANLLMYKKVFEDACDAGYEYVSFGWTGTASLATFKEQFKGTRVPVRTYEKRYSKIRLLMEYLSLVLERTWYDKTYLWKQRHRIFNMLTNR